MSKIIADARGLVLDKILRDLDEEGRILLLRRLLGPLTDTELLTHREAAIIFCRAARGASFSQLAKELGISPERVRQVSEAADKKMKSTQKKVQRGTAVWQECPFGEPRRVWVTNFESCSDVKECLRDNCRYKRQE